MLWGFFVVLEAYCKISYCNILHYMAQICLHLDYVRNVGYEDHIVIFEKMFGCH